MKKCGIPENNSVFVKGEWKTEDPYYQAIALLNEKVEALEEEISSGSGLDERIQKLESLYGVGSIWITVSNDDPGTIFGGIWEKLEDRYLIGSGVNAAGNIGGSSSQDIVLGIENLPFHTHHMSEYTVVFNGAYANRSFGTGTDEVCSLGWVDQSWDGDDQKYPDHGNTDVQNDSSNESPSQVEKTPITVTTMPPFIAVNIWKRTA